MAIRSPLYSKGTSFRAKPRNLRSIVVAEHVFGVKIPPRVALGRDDSVIWEYCGEGIEKPRLSVKTNAAFLEQGTGIEPAKGLTH